jgi:hydrogenase maturation protease
MILVIGYGNELRRDDGVGPRVARAVAAWDLPGVLALARHQLTPELAEAVAGADAVFFVDAAADLEPGVRVRPVCSGGSRSVLGHVSSPAELLDLAAALHGHRPPAWLVSIPAADLGFGEELSPAATHGMDEALRHIRQHFTADPLQIPRFASASSS